MLMDTFLKYVQDLHNKNCKTLLRKTKDANKWKISHVHGLEDVILLRYPFSPKDIQINYNPNHNLTDLFVCF